MSAVDNKALLIEYYIHVWPVTDEPHKIHIFSTKWEKKPKKHKQTNVGVLHYVSSVRQIVTQL